METYQVLLDLTIIVAVAELFGLIARKLHAPQVVGEIIAGLIIGPSVLGIVSTSDFLNTMAEIGVILLMFSAGLGTSLRDLRKTGLKALAIACVGVLIPLIGGTLLYLAFYGPAGFGTEKFYTALFMGVIMTATSVSITVQTLKELGKLKGEVGTTILSAAIIDDVIGIIVLTFVIGLKNSEVKPSSVILNTVLFFVLAGVLGLVIFWAFNKLDRRYPHKRRIPIFGLALCFFFAYAAEKFFGIADITGAYVAGVILCSLHDSQYIEEKIDTESYMLFGPLFFASIGLKTDISSIDGNILLFSVCFVLVALITKVIGCGIAAKLLRHSNLDSLKIGVGMMTRGEVALIVAQKGLDVGLLDSVYFTSVILLIVVSSICTPIVLKFLYAKDTE